MNQDQKSPISVDTLLGHEIVPILNKTITFTKQDGTADAGEVAGTVVLSILPFAPIRSLLGDRIGEYTGSALSTSIVFTTGVLDSTKEIAFEYNGLGNERFTKTIAKMVDLPNGTWALDYLTGALVIKKKTAGTSQVITSYKVCELDSNFSATVTSEAQYNLVAPTYNDGDPTTLQSDVNGNLKVVEQYAPVAEDNTRGVIATQNKPEATGFYAWSVDKSDALEASTQTKAAAGVVRSISGRIDSTAANGTYYVQLIDANGPPDGAVQLLAAPLKIQHTNGNDSNFSMDFSMNCIKASTAIFLCLSSTEFTKTIAGAFLSTTILYK